MLPIRLNDGPTTLLDAARRLYNQHADQTAVVMIDGDDETAISTRTFFEQAARYARALEQAGVRAGDLVALILQHGPDVLYSFWGAMLLGATPSIFPFLTEKLDPETYFDSVRALVAHEAIRVIITYEDLQADLDHTVGNIATLSAIINKDTLQAEGNAASYLSLNPAQPESTAFLQHSSGSTGLQKGVMLSHRGVLNQIAAYSEAIDLHPDDVVVTWLPLYHDMGLIAGFIMPIVQGIKLVMMSPFQWVRDPKRLLQAIHRHQGTLCWLPNFAYNFMATRIRPRHMEGLDLSSMRAFINCSEPVQAASHTTFAQAFAPIGLPSTALATCYAMAENTFAVTQSAIGQMPHVDRIDRTALMDERQAHPVPADHADAQTFVSNGKPIHNCEVKICDDDGHTLPDRHIGEIYVRSDSMLSGYYARLDLNQSLMIDGWYRTEDMGYLVDGALYITGRKKDLIIVGGKNIYPQDIENLLNDIDGIHAGRTTAFGVFNDQLGTEDIVIVAEVEPEIDPQDRTQTAPIQRAIRACVVQQTDVTARYVHLVGPKWLIKTSSGKIARTANREKFLNTVLNR
jgi:fatty-acyl-CoA synthase